MILRYLFYWLFFIPLCVILIIFALNNRDIISIDLWPFSYYIEAPLYMIVFVIGAVCMFVGYMMACIVFFKKKSQDKKKKYMRLENREIKKADSIKKLNEVSSNV